MQSAQESLAELRAAIRYCENAISAAESTIESMDFRQQIARQESTGREVALSKTVKELEVKNKALDDENMHLQKVVIDLETFVEELRDDKVRLNKEVADLKEKLKMEPTLREKLLREDIDTLILENTKLKLEQKDLNFDNAQLQEANDYLEKCIAELELELKENKTNVADSNI
jgi:chromosome segregation ATPase